MGADGSVHSVGTDLTFSGNKYLAFRSVQIQYIFIPQAYQGGFVCAGKVNQCKSLVDVSIAKCNIIRWGSTT